MNTGVRWAWGLLDGLSRAIAVVVLVAAVALPSFLTDRPVWQSLLVVGVLLLAIFAEGTYRVWYEAEARGVLGRESARDADDQTKASAQLAAAIRSGNVLRVRGHMVSPLGLQWRDEVEAFIKDAAGELDASRLTHSGDISHWLQLLDDLARQAGEDRTLTPSGGWDSYVTRMGDFKQALDIHLGDGEHIRRELFDRSLDAEQGEAMVGAWLRAVNDSFEPVPRLLGMSQDNSLAGMFATYEGLPDDESRNVWRVDVRLQDLQPLLTAVTPYVEALQGK